MKPMNQTWAPFIQVALPIVIAIFIAAWLNNRRVDTLEKRIDSLETSVNKRIDGLETSLNKRIDDLYAETRALRAEIMPILREIQAAIKDLERRITILEQRLGPIVRA
jgi:predicted  nucleic acid-binding Zn-ribbon protein